MFFKSITTWLFVVIVATIHIRFQKVFVAPGVGELAAHVVGTLIWSGAILVIALVFVIQAELENKNDPYKIGSIWLLLSVLLLIVEKAVMKEASLSFAPENLASLDGLFLSINLLFLFFAPKLAAMISQKIVTRDS